MPSINFSCDEPFLRKQACYLLHTRNRMYWSDNRWGVPGNTTKTCGGGSTPPCILNFSAIWSWVVRFTAWQLYPMETTPKCTVMKTEWVPEPVQTFWRQVSCPCQVLNNDTQFIETHSLVTMLTTLSWLRHRTKLNSQNLRFSQPPYSQPK